MPAKRKPRHIVSHDPSIDSIHEAYTYLTGQPFPSHITCWDILNPIVETGVGSMFVGLVRLSWYEATEAGTPVVMSY